MPGVDNPDAAAYSAKVVCNRCGKEKQRHKFDTVRGTSGTCVNCATTCSWCEKKKPRKYFRILDSATEGNVCKKCHNEYHDELEKTGEMDE